MTPRKIKCLRNIEGAGRDLLGERDSLDEFQHQTANTTTFLNPVNGADVRVIQRRENARLALEARQPAGILSDGVGKHLDCDVASELRVVRAIHVAHAAAADQRANHVRTQ
jgi:hypothetical protein